MFASYPIRNGQAKQVKGKGKERTGAELPLIPQTRVSYSGESGRYHLDIRSYDLSIPSGMRPRTMVEVLLRRSMLVLVLVLVRRMGVGWLLLRWIRVLGKHTRYPYMLRSSDRVKGGR
jgi:hypothetical protein